MRNRQHRIEFRLNDREYAKFGHAVKKSGLNSAQYVRHLINGRVPQDRPGAEYFDLLRELRAIGRNINQIALVANAAGVIDAGKYDERYDALLALILKVIEAAEMPREAP
jgi:hypothetical protein